MAVEYQTRTITPDEARRLLERNQGNRNLKETAIRRYMADMTSGDWMLNGEAIKIDRDGNLRDGQNRLTACVRANVPFTTTVVTGLDPNAQASMDQGVKRTNADAVTFAFGTRYAALMASVAGADRAWHQYGPVAAYTTSGNHTLSAAQTLEWLESHPNISEDLAADATDAARRMGGLLTPRAFALTLLRLREVDRAMADRFLHLLVVGAGMDEDDPILVARNRLMRLKDAKAPQAVRAAVVFKAWNKWRIGARVKVIGWSPDGEFPLPR